MIDGQLSHEFVPVIPGEIKADTLYVCIPYATAVHRCPGCERKVVTPFAPRSWNLIFDGETVSIRPSIRNGAHGCGSHYFIERDRFVRTWDPSERSGSLEGVSSKPWPPVKRVRRRARAWLGRLVHMRPSSYLIGPRAVGRWGGATMTDPAASDRERWASRA